jgi:hypothetical protein
VPCEEQAKASCAGLWKKVEVQCDLELGGRIRQPAHGAKWWDRDSEERAPLESPEVVPLRDDRGLSPYQWGKEVGTDARDTTFRDTLSLC